MVIDTHTQRDIFSVVFGHEKKTLLNNLKGFEMRPQQIAMAQHLMDAFDKEQHALVEAATGVGKSLAYLLPIIQWTNRTGKKVVISTFTKTLQDQLVHKDLPRLKKILGIDFRYALCIGSQNFLCKRRFHKNGLPELFANAQEKDALQRIARWVETTESGMRSDLSFEPNDALWSQMSRESELCLGQKSPYHEECFYYKNRKEIYSADIFVTNHSLFFAHIASGGHVLPPFDAVLFDEAHTLEDIATECLGARVSNTQLKFHLDSFAGSKTGQGFWRRIKGLSKADFERGVKLADEVRKAGGIFFSEVINSLGGECGKIRIKKRGLFMNCLDQPVHRLVSFLADALRSVQTKEDEVEIVAFIDRFQKMAHHLNAILGMHEPECVYWVEILSGSKDMKCSLHKTPLNIAHEFREKILEGIRPSIFVSATLSVNGRFDFYKEIFGMDNHVRELTLDSPFDYKRNVLLYLPGNMPDPGDEPERFYEKALEEVNRIVSLMQGRMFILFTNVVLMGKVYQELKKEFGHLCILRQGEMPKYRLIGKFKKNEKAILLGTNTFWQGVDIPGRALECVVIWKLPFAVPDDPIAEAKAERLRAQGKNPFVHYQLPRAIIMTRQGFGRLIRRQTDKGIVAILDPRLRTKSYGEDFLRALPLCTRVYRFRDVERFFVDRMAGAKPPQVNV